MGETRWLDERENRSWRGLIATMMLLDSALDRQLQRDQQLSHAHYMIMAMLSAAPSRTMHMSRLASITHSSQSRLSHAVTRLEQEGRVVRSPCPQNRRAVHATLTDSGLDAVVRAAPGHVAEVRRLLFDRLDADQVDQLIAITDATLSALHDAGFDPGIGEARTMAERSAGAAPARGERVEPVERGERVDGLDPNSVLAKVMDVLMAFRTGEAGVTMAELQGRTGIAKASLHRVVTDLVSARMLDRDGRSYRLSSTLFELGQRASAERDLVDAATPYMEDLYELAHETVHLGVRGGDEVVYLAKIGGHRQPAAPSQVGGRLPLHCTAIGKALLAHSPDPVVRAYLARPLSRRTAHTLIAPGLLAAQLRRVAETGLAYEREESAPGITCVAAPVLGPDGSGVAALSVMGPLLRFDPRRVAESVRSAATGVQEVLAARAAHAARAARSAH